MGHLAATAVVLLLSASPAKGDQVAVAGERPAQTEVTRASELPKLEAFLTASRKRRSSSRGEPTQGRLHRGIALPRKGTGFVRRNRDRYYGTHETIALVRYAAARLAAAYPGTAPLLVGDISEKAGGKAPPHRSHQSGRDVDIGFVERSNTTRTQFKGDLSLDEIDVDRSWFVMETLLQTGKVQYIFINETLLRRFASHARAMGWTRDAVDALFVLPGERIKRGAVRHADGHTYHFHVRFHCPEGDRHCSG